MIKIGKMVEGLFHVFKIFPEMAKPDE